MMSLPGSGSSDLNPGWLNDDKPSHLSHPASNVWDKGSHRDMWLVQHLKAPNFRHQLREARAQQRVGPLAWSSKSGCELNID